MHAHEVHAHEVHAHEVHAHEVHAHEVHAHESKKGAMYSRTVPGPPSSASRASSRQPHPKPSGG
jgi:hypothetical protein